VQIGDSAGPGIRLTGDALRTSGLEVYGAARNALTGMAAAYRQVVEWVRDGALKIPIAAQPHHRGVDPHRPARPPPVIVPG
jgi:NADPH2:quinone reductase